MLTNPSPPELESYSGRSNAAAARRSSMASSSYKARLEETLGTSSAIGRAYSGSVVIALPKIAGLEVSPAIRSSRMRRASVPSRSMRRLMSSSHALWPSLRNSSSGLGTGALIRSLFAESSAADRAGARHGHLRAQQPLASRGGGRERRAAARPHDGPALMGAPASALGGLLRAAFDALRTRLDLAAVELEIHLLSLARVLVWL